LLDVIQGVSVMMKGHSGQGVQDLQRILNQMGANPPLAEDGLFGPKTEAALVAFQKSAGAPNPNGRFGRDSLLAVQTNRAFWNDGGFDYKNYALSEAIAPAGGFIPPITGPNSSATGKDGGRRAPHLGDHPPEGSVRAADLAAADQARRARTPKEAPEISNDGRTINLNTRAMRGNLGSIRATRTFSRAGPSPRPTR
jgi:peptidoglycan hydrolase-like protein with peptidoglycan-binding domain